MKVPYDVYRIAKTIWISGLPETDAVRWLRLVSWAKLRWPTTTLPHDHEQLAFWVVSIAIQDGVENAPADLPEHSRG